MSNTIELDLTNPDLAPLKDKQPGETCDLKGVTVEVTANDGKTLSGNITEAELGDDYSDDESSEGDKSAADDSSDGAEKPIAVVALGIGKKKPM